MLAISGMVNPDLDIQYPGRSASIVPYAHFDQIIY